MKYKINEILVENKIKKVNKNFDEKNNENELNAAIVHILHYSENDFQKTLNLVKDSPSELEM